MMHPERLTHVRFLSTAEAAELAGVTPSAIIQARNAGTLKPAAQIGRTFGFTEEEVQRWIQWRTDNPPQTRRWGWNGGTPRPRGTTQT